MLIESVLTIISIALDKERSLHMEKGALGNAIRTARVKMNLTQEQVAEMVDI